MIKLGIAITQVEFELLSFVHERQKKIVEEVLQDGVTQNEMIPLDDDLPSSVIYSDGVVTSLVVKGLIEVRSVDARTSASLTMAGWYLMSHPDNPLSRLLDDIAYAIILNSVGDDTGATILLEQYVTDADLHTARLEREKDDG